MRTSSASTVRNILDVATRLGIDVQPWLQEVGLQSAALEDPEARVALPLTDRLIRSLVKASGDPDVILDAVLSAPTGQLAIFHYVTINCHDIEEYLELNQSFSRLWGDGVELSWAQRDDVVTVTFDTPDGELRGADVLRVVTQAWVGAVCLRARIATDLAFAPTAVSLTHDAPAETGRMLQIFGVEPTFAAPTNTLTFPAEQLALRFPPGDPNLVPLLRTRAQGLLERLPGTEELGMFVRDRIRSALARGPVTLEEMAAGLAMGPRTLQRRLSSEGASFRELLDGCQRELAVELIGDPNLSIAEISNRLAFETQSAFTKKFKRWTGRTPRDFRRHLDDSTGTASQ